VTINPANPLKSVKLADNDFVKDNKITASLDSDGMIYLKSDATANATGNVKIIFATEYGDYTSEDIDVTIDTNLPTSTFKQTGVLNTFYSSDLDRSTPDAIFTVTSSKDYQIEDIELADNEKFGKVEYDGNTVSLWTTGLNSTTLNNFNNSVTANLKITYKDLGTVNQSVQVKTKSTPIKLAISGATVIKGNPTFTVSVTNANTKQAVGNIKVSIDNKSSVEKTSDDISNDGNVTLKYTGTKTANYTATFSSSDWTSQASAKGKITYVKTPKLVFGNKAAIVSENAKTSYVSVSISNTDVKIGDNVTITATGKKATEANEKLNVTFDLENQRIVATLKNPDAAQTKATYNYTVIYTLDENTTLTAKFNVNVLASNNNTVTGTFKKKGTINLLNVNEYMTLTPTLVNTTAKIDSIDTYTVSSVATKTKPSEDVTDQFILEKLDSGELKLAYKNNEEVEKKLEAKQKYNVDVTFKLTDGTTAKATIKDVKPVAKLPSKTTATNTKGTLNLNQDKAFNTNIVTTSKTGSNAISKIVIADTSIKCKDKKAYSATELFDVDSINYEYNPSNAAVSIKLTDKAKELLASGKKYSVKLNVYYETGATTDSFKPVTLSITVK
jgi:hypothetical protein